MVTVEIPHRNGTSDAIPKTLRGYNIKTFFLSDNNLQRNLLKVRPTEREKRTNCVHRILCAECSVSYVGQTARQLHERIKEHKRHSRFPQESLKKT
ncbi:hypothetical protein CLF_108085 [Clonorchis sinensis]|uniref:C2H2-type domain-containing protein n=1 Tax=Clonorchis sinensis TaxID=79923 RepID=H2KS46_CLOSI|nr:hypothetical protein CLF_108085 [Clonorchis sinensis]